MGYITELYDEKCSLSMSLKSRKNRRFYRDLLGRLIVRLYPDLITKSVDFTDF